MLTRSLRFACWLLLVGSQVACARHDLPELDLDENDLIHRHADAGKPGTPEPKPEPDPGQGDGDGDGDDEQGPDEPARDASTPEEHSDAGPSEADRTPAASNVDGCPDTAPKDGFNVGLCNPADGFICKYGPSFSCYCSGPGWVCTK
ncbi:MAG: hypothetical protein QM778_20760 [Myxococcales bacterium]